MVYDASAAQAVGLSAMHLRGGSWNNNQDNARAVYRNNNNPNIRNNNIGFRVVVRPTPLSLFYGHQPRGGCRAVPFYQGSMASGNAGRVRFAGRGEEMKKAQMDPVRTGEKHRRAHIKPGTGGESHPFSAYDSG
ncbi:MAG: SUMF1/EgtB/PvdO family nonheme iron enzyme [Blastocatellales bacterium]